MVARRGNSGRISRVFDPELAARETARPIALEVQKGNEVAAAWALARQCLNSKSALPWSITISTASPQRTTIAQIIGGKPKDLDVKVDSLTGDYVEHLDTITVANFSELKGFEFSLVVLVGCSDGFLPLPGRSKDEAWRDALRLYVAMTRARDSVYLIYSQTPSAFLKIMDKKIEWQTSESQRTSKRPKRRKKA